MFLLRTKQHLQEGLVECMERGFLVMSVVKHSDSFLKKGLSSLEVS